jgi:hypothetical protein
MSKVTVYQYMVLDTDRNERRESRRWGTREGIASFGDFVEILEDTAIEVDASAVDSLGFTTFDFDPQERGVAARLTLEAWRATARGSNFNRPLDYQPSGVAWRLRRRSGDRLLR